MVTSSLFHLRPCSHGRILSLRAKNTMAHDETSETQPKTRLIQAAVPVDLADRLKLNAHVRQTTQAEIVAELIEKYLPPVTLTVADQPEAPAA